MRIVAALIVVLVSGQVQPRALRAGVMVASGDTRILALEGPLVAVGAAVTVVAIGDGQEVSHATISKQLSKPDVMAKHDVRGPFYELVEESGSKPLPTLAVVILGRADVIRANTVATLRLGNPPVDIRVRSCTSYEGVHLTLWAGAPLKSPRLWHMYFYLGYDVEPTCTPADYGDGDYQSVARGAGRADRWTIAALSNQSREKRGTLR